MDLTNYNIVYKGSILDNSGYGVMGRDDIKAMCEVGIDVIGESVIHTTERCADIYIGNICEKKTDTSKKTIKLIAQTPELFINSAEYNIGITLWETDRIPKEWVVSCNKMDEVWVRSKWNKAIFEKCGVTVPIYSIPCTIDVDCIDNIKPNLELKNVIGNRYVFYYIFQWTPRKGWSELLKAYYSEFLDKTNVLLILKTFRGNTSKGEVGAIKKDINELKHSMGSRFFKFPDVLLITNNLTMPQIYSLHKTADCFVGPSLGEGWGLPWMEAMLAGNPTVATNWSAVLEFMNKENSFLIDYDLEPVNGMPWIPWYRCNQQWSLPSISDLRKKMRWIFENRNKAKAIGEIAKKNIKQKFNYKVVGNLMKERLMEITKNNVKRITK